jgi:hypothetical protein
MKIIKSFLLILFCILFLNNTKNRNYRPNFVVIEKEILLAREYFLDQNNFSMGSIYSDLPWRISPLMIEFTSIKNITEYKDTVYTFMTDLDAKSLNIKSFEIKNCIILDSILDSKIINKNKLFKFKVKRKYFKKVKSELKKYKSDLKFDGFFYYAIFKLKIQYIIGNKRKMILPNLNNEGSKGIVKIEDRNINFIINIKDIALQTPTLNHL